MIRLCISVLGLALLAACTTPTATTTSKKPPREISNQEIASYVPRWVDKMDVRPSPRPTLPTADLLRGEAADFVVKVFGEPLQRMNAGEAGLWVYRTDLCTMHLFVKDNLVTEVILRPMEGEQPDQSLLNRCFRTYLASRVDQNKIQ